MQLTYIYIHVLLTHPYKCYLELLFTILRVNPTWSMVDQI